MVFFKQKKKCSLYKDEVSEWHIFSIQSCSWEHINDHLPRRRKSGGRVREWGEGDGGRKDEKTAGSSSIKWQIFMFCNSCFGEAEWCPLCEGLKGKKFALSFFWGWWHCHFCVDTHPLPGTWERSLSPIILNTITGQWIKRDMKNTFFLAKWGHGSKYSRPTLYPPLTNLSPNFQNSSPHCLRNLLTLKSLSPHTKTAAKIKSCFF